MNHFQMSGTYQPDLDIVWEGYGSCLGNTSDLHPSGGKTDVPLMSSCSAIFLPTHVLSSSFDSQFQVDTRASGSQTYFQGTDLHPLTSWLFLDVSSHSVLILLFVIAAYPLCCRYSATPCQVTQAYHSVQTRVVFACPELSVLHQKLFGDHSTSVCMSLSLILSQNMIICVIYRMTEKAWWTDKWNNLPHSSLPLPQKRRESKAERTMSKTEKDKLRNKTIIDQTGLTILGTNGTGWHHWLHQLWWKRRRNTPCKILKSCRVLSMSVVSLDWSDLLHYIFCIDQTDFEKIERTLSWNDATGENIRHNAPLLRRKKKKLRAYFSSVTRTTWPDLSLTSCWELAVWNQCAEIRRNVVSHAMMASHGNRRNGPMKIRLTGNKGRSPGLKFRAMWGPLRQ